MEKNDIYDHLAKIYLEPPQRETAAVTPKRTKITPYAYGIAGIIFFIAVVLIIARFIPHKDAKPIASETARVLTSGPVRLQFQFNAAKKEMYRIDLNAMDMSVYQSLSFAVRKEELRENISMKVEFVNAYNERAEFFVKNITSSWSEYTIKLADVKGITDWTSMKHLAFIVEEWNTDRKKGTVILEDMKLVRK